jgi:hypothetical protein
VNFESMQRVRAEKLPRTMNAIPRRDFRFAERRFDFSGSKRFIFFDASKTSRQECLDLHSTVLVILS